MQDLISSVWKRSLAGWGPFRKARGILLAAQTGDYSSAVVAAAAGGEAEIVEFLLREGSTNMDTMLQSVEHRSALAVAAYWGWIGCAESLIDAGADVNLKLKSGHYGTALQASQVDVSQENRERAWWDERDEKTLKQDKARVTELLQRHGAINVSSQMYVR